MATGERPPDETFGAKIRRVRRERQLTQREVASRLKIDFTYLSKLENDRGETPGEDTVRKLATVLEIDEEELLASAGKLPPALRAKAQKDVEFARFLRRLPGASDKQLRGIYRQLDTKRPKQ